MEHLDEIAEQFKSRTGRAPHSMRELIQAGMIGGEPLDPLGYAYTISAKGKAQISEKSPLFKQQTAYRRPL